MVADDIAVELIVRNERLLVIPMPYERGWFPHFVHQLFDGTDPMVMHRIEAVLDYLYAKLGGLTWEDANTCTGEAVTLFLELWDEEGRRG